MLVRVKLVGQGTEADPHRVPLPTFREVFTSHDAGYAYVLIPDEDHPALETAKSAKRESTGHGNAIVGLDGDGHKAWYDHLDGRYQEHKGEFRPEIA